MNSPTETLTPVGILDAAAKNFADARALLAQRMQAHQAEIAAITKRLMPDIQKAAALAAQAEAGLRTHIDGNRELFTKPRSMTLHGIKLGFQKGKGRISWTDAGKVCELIRTKLPNEADSLIKTTEVPIAAALLNLDIATLKKIGCTVTDTDDQIVIKSANSEIDKLVTRLLAEYAENNG